MAKAFEYSIYTVSWGHGAATDGIAAELNARGEKGWELVGMTRDESPQDDHDEEVVMFVFSRKVRKRRKSNRKGKKKKS